MHKPFVTAVVVAAGALGTAHAQAVSPVDQSVPGAKNDNLFMLGAGVVSGPRYPGARALETTPVPFVVINHEVAPGHDVYVRGLGAGYAYEVNDRLSVGLHAQYRGERDTDDDAELAGLPKVDRTVEAGPRVRYQLTPQTGVEARVLTDIGDGHDGTTARVGLDHALPLSERLRLKLGAGLNYGSEDFVNAYYGVPSYAARADRRAFHADGGITHVDTEATATYALNAKWSVQGGLGLDFLTGDAADSPLNDADVQPKLLLGALYRF